MTITTLGIIILAIAIYIDKRTLFKHDALPAAAFAGLVTIIASLIM